MSNISNDILAEGLFGRLEELEPVMNLQQYTNLQQELLGLLARGQFQEAHQAVIKWEQDYGGSLADLRAQDRQEMASDVY